MENRHFTNSLPDYVEENLILKDNQLAEPFNKTFRDEVNKQVEHLIHGLDQWLDWKDYSVYTGTTGIALLYLHLHEKLQTGGEESDYLQKALFYVEKPLRHLKRRKASFLGGDGGPLAVGAVIYHKLNKTQDRDDCIKRLVSRHKDVVEDSSMPDELLNGRVGYLYAILFLRKHIGQSVVHDDVVKKVLGRVLSSGESLSRRQRSASPLMFEWHEKKYLGAAHGMAGIITILLQLSSECSQSALSDLIRPTIDYLTTLRFPSGNFPSSVESRNGDRLVHWCHGAPGWIYMFLQAYKVFGDEKYLTQAVSCSEVIWTRGLLKKGYGICHGAAGNAYAFLALYRVTKEQKHLYRAAKFGEWCCDYGKHGCPTPDRPYSLFEGLAGTIYFLVDILHPDDSRFPAFEV